MPHEDAEEPTASSERERLTIIAALADHVPAMLAFWDRDQRCVYANRAYFSWFGVRVDELIGQHISTLLGPLYERNRRYIEGALAGVEQLFDREIPDPRGGPTRLSQAQYIPHRVDGSVVGFFAMVVDISHRREAERAQVELARTRAERLASINRLAAGVAHEVNNPLAVALASINDALYKLPVDLDTAIISSLREARDAVTRAAATLGGLTLLGKGESERRERVDVDRVLRASLRIAAAGYRYRARLDADLRSRAWIDGDESQLSQVFVHLLINAGQAMVASSASGHVLTVRSRIDGEEVVIEIGDTGDGISEEVVSRIFEPFVTTRPHGEGRGLGLHFAHAIVTGFGGTMEFTTRAGLGTTFRVRLPIAERGASGDVRAAPPRLAIAGDPDAPERKPRLVWVDDEAALTRIFSRALARRYDVAAFEDPVDALECIGRWCPDLVLSDVMMPRLTGPELYVRALAAEPLLQHRFLFMTGGAYTPESRAFLRGHVVLTKPFSVEALYAAIDRRLGAVGLRAATELAPPA